MQWVSLDYLLRGSIERAADLNSPFKKAYGMLKEAVVGGQSLMFTRYHEAEWRVSDRAVKENQSL